MVFKVVGQMMEMISDWISSVVFVVPVFLNSVVIFTCLWFSRTYSYL